MRQAHVDILEHQGTVCVIPGCGELWTDAAHVEASGMGGRPSTNLWPNVVGMCRMCHDIFDGRVMQGRQRMMRALLWACLDG